MQNELPKEGLSIHTLPLGPWDNFIYFLADEATKTCAVVDPAWHAPSILQEAERLGLQITHILCTHSHFDHVNRVEKLLETGEEGGGREEKGGGGKEGACLAERSAARRG